MDFILTNILEFVLYGVWTSTWVSLIIALIVGIIVGSIVWGLTRRRQRKSFKDSILPAIIGTYIGSLLAMIVVIGYSYSLRNSGPYAIILLMIVVPIALVIGSVPGAIVGGIVEQKLSAKIKRKTILLGIGIAYGILTLALVLIVEKPPVPQLVKISNHNSDSSISIGKFIGHGGRINSLAFSSDGQILASSARDNTIRVWHIGDGKLLKTIRTGIDAPVDIAFTPDGKTLAAASSKGVELWEWQNEQVTSLFSDDCLCQGVAISQDGQYIASMSGNNNLKTGITIWQLKTGKLIQTLKEESKYGFFKDIAISPDGQTLVSSGNGVIKLWQLPTGKLVKSINVDYTADAMSIHPSGKSFITFTNNSIEIRDLPQGKLLKTLPSHTVGYGQGLAVSPDGKILASSYADKMIEIWLLTTGKKAQTLKDAGDWALAISPDSQTLASGLENDIKIWRLP